MRHPYSWGPRNGPQTPNARTRPGQAVARLENNQALLPLIDAKFKSNTREHWLELLARHDIPAAPVQTIAEFMDDPAVCHNEMVREYDHPEVGRLRLMGQPLVFADTPTRDPGPPPTLGQHTDEILNKDLGLDPQSIAEMRRKKEI